MLEVAAFHVYAASSVAEARAILNQNHIDIVLLDMVLDREMGTDLLPVSVPVLVLTASLPPPGFGLPVMHKPIESRELVRRILELVR
jgi:DNA-binding response OmpR family regulator